MKQILQSLKTGEISLAEVPAPKASAGCLLIATKASLISAGTERMLLSFGQANLWDKMRQQPEKVAQVVDKIRTDGLIPTVKAVRNKLDQPLALGYCQAGVVVAVGSGVVGYAIGDRVASNGKHAELVNVPVNLCAKIPANVSDEEAAFTVAAAIALQGIRLAAPNFGEAVVVTGLGLIGLLTVQLLLAQGCRVLGIDFDEQRLAMARQMGAISINPNRQDVPQEALQFSAGRGVDAVLITASTKSDEPIRQAAQISRQRGRIVLVGVTGLALNRADFYEKELSFQVSCSYGPGRYDPQYEDKGLDYPIGFVRWTEQRNFEAILAGLAAKRLDFTPLVSHRFAINHCQEAYQILSGGAADSLAIILTYPDSQRFMEEPIKRDVSLVNINPVGSPIIRASSFVNTRSAWPVTIGFLGAGNYAGQILIPAFKAAGAKLKTIVSANGVSGIHHGRKHGFTKAASDDEALWADPEIDAVVIATRHAAHPSQVAKALASGKHVFVEKPLAIDDEGLTLVTKAYENHPNLVLMVGFNRRFSPHIVKLHQLIAPMTQPKSLIITVNAGGLDERHWTKDNEIGGGRIIGEACHFIDLARFLLGNPFVDYRISYLGMGKAASHPQEDVCSITLNTQDGSQATIHYLANGHRGFPKERIEVFAGGRILQLDNFRRLVGWGWPHFSKQSTWRQDKGQLACVQNFLSVIAAKKTPTGVREGVGNFLPIPYAELQEVTRVAWQIATSPTSYGLCLTDSIIH